MRSQNATRYGMDNTPNTPNLINIVRTARRMEQVRRLLQSNPVYPSSWYRSEQVNRLAKGATKSKHIEGLAIDFTCDAFGTPAQIVDAIADSNIKFDKVIVEFSQWVHFAIERIGRPARGIIMLATHNSSGDTIYRQV